MIEGDGHFLALQIPREDRSMDETVKKTSAKPKAKSKAKAPATPLKKNAAANGAATNVTEMKITHQQVAELAHRFWAERGRQHGHDADDWFRAEQALRGKAS
jgi:Protein of unknown function (DUF2934)